MHLIFIDTESSWDEALHEDYRKLDPRKHQHHRMASKRIFAAAAFDIIIDLDGKTSVGGLTSWTEHSHGTEEAIVSELFDHLRFRPQASVVSWGGLAADIPILTLAAMEHHLVLPSQVQVGRPVKWGEARPHCDLALEMKGQGRDWAHLSEVGLRLGLPPALFAGKSRVNFPRSDGEWLATRHHVEFDTVLLSLICLAWRRTQGQIRGDWTAMAYQIVEWFLRHRQADPSFTQALCNVRQSMLDRLHTRFLEAA